MFWDKVASVYDFFENVYNGKVYKGTGQKVAEEIEKGDEVLECACGTGVISVYIAPTCAHLVATDISKNKVVAGNVIQKRHGIFTQRPCDIGVEREHAAA